VGDLGTHAYHLLRYITGLKAQAIAEAATRSLHSGRTETIEY
jgi:hypothetical protein